MSQYDFGTIDPNTKSGTALATDLNSWRNALHSTHGGSSAPSYITAGMLWADTTSANYELKMYDGAQSITVAVIDATNNVARVAVDSAETSYITSTTSAQISHVIASTNIFTTRSTGIQFNLASPVIADSNNNELISFTTTASAVNHIDIANSATTAAVALSAAGTDTNISIALTPKGTGVIAVNGGATVSGGVRTNAILDASGGNTATVNGMTPTAQSLQGFRNRIINGDMRIDQRNAGASVTGGFAVDRFEFQENSAAAFTIQRSTVAPAGFVNSMLVTVTTAGSATAAQVNRFFERIEGNNIADLGLGTASASTVTLSFWVRSSLTGTYCASLVNNAANRAYVAEYSISTANTWEYKTITIAGDTTGTWETGTSSGIQVTFDLGSGSDYNATAGSWVAANDFRTTNQVNFANTSGATFYITGVQLEAGSVATPFERRDYGTELARCQRYCYVPSTFAPTFALAWVTGAAAFQGGNLTHPQTMRATPTISGVSSFTIQGVTASAVGFAYAGTTHYLSLGSANSNGQGDGVFRTVNGNQIPVISAEL